MADHSDGIREIAEAYAAVRREVLPGVALALEQAGPASLLITELVIADIMAAGGWRNSELLANLTLYLAAIEAQP